MIARKALRKAASLYWRWRLSPTARAVSRARLTYLSPAKLYNLEHGVIELDRQGVAGDCLEFGVALGGSAIVIAKAMSGGRRFIGYDLFGTIPPPSERDDPHSHARYQEIAAGKAKGIGNDPYYGYEANLYDKVKGNFAAFRLKVDGQRIQLVKGLFEETLSPEERSPVAFAHLDCDWHDPVAFCLEALYPRLSKGAVVVLDDYNSYGGCRTATDAFLKTHPDVRLVSSKYHALLTRT